MIYFVSGGGTAGHIYPAISIIEAIKKLDADSEFYYVGISGKLEEEIAKREGITFLPIVSKPLAFRSPKKTFAGIKAFFKGVKIAKTHIDKYKPDAVICTGGYVSGPIGYAAHKKNVPLFIHESNAYPGRTTKFLDKFSKITFLPYESVKKEFKKTENKIVAGTPIRKGFSAIKSPLKERHIVLSFGGSGGQKTLNDAIADIFNKNKSMPFDWIHISGRDWEKEFEAATPDLPKYATVYSYYHDFYDLMAKADLVICGCGAQTLNEVSAMRKPSILIPKMYVVNNHQYLNAKKYEDESAGKIIKETDLTGQRLLDLVKEMLDDPNKLKQMGENANKLYVKDSADIIAKYIYKELV
ncbi:MAG: UDP-N-acetylglucosamine--N-acetylmuramyl-(pentapeptide) pyrophosphoryl-undecaprenol N-acetylglucosamine transferase [Ezakiella sp.]|nr:UDP-N-acetylglucosamine--N-acetylmuramyl-(pentapeptide) pyrophosphoryl-undecaprenol N-acetylglucosamine transferase [Ezakiella sp.]MDD7472058.1 UDP-N-acetylglucosamine--N-acetylmuramyl-(pentapeptide) pyrophosphoryl-undecaprenol N-acetylglucosamine transferase [Bacillota bacterium]MDY3924022.1 UDP-N-acetylglucosamine--N-acetylmuramyl-(pentapeptide) pyrophosphoryl-undecaprenol N-acetylglucosamine transferase [Ezakiella sp.]